MKPNPSELTREQLEAMTRHTHELVKHLMLLIQTLPAKLNAIDGLPDEARTELAGWQAAIGDAFKVSDATVDKILNTPSGNPNLN